MMFRPRQRQRNRQHKRGGDNDPPQRLVTAQEIPPNLHIGDC
jgi:hypothetical protein